jgi:flagellar biosynthesis/type III secretory pathway protein FliH
MPKSTASHRRPSFLGAVSAPSEAPARFTSVERPLRPSEVAALAEAAARIVPEAKPDPAATARAVERLNLGVILLRAQGERLAEQARADALELAFMIARRILEREIHTDPVALLSLIRSAITRAGEANQITVRLSPQDAEALQAAGHQLNEQTFSLATVTLILDPKLGPGDCIIETNLGTVDGRLTTRLQEMRETVEAAIEQGIP